MIRDWLEQIRSDEKVPGVIAERCVHTRAEVATCRACVDSCPHEAWVINDELLGIEGTRCDGCGICSAVCPQEAIEKQQAPLIFEYKGNRVVLACCEKRAIGIAGMNPELQIPCMHGMGYRDLAEIHRQGVYSLYLFTAECEACTRGARLSGHQQLEMRLEQINRLLDLAGAPQITLYRLDARQWHKLVSHQDKIPHTRESSRRSFLRQGVNTLLSRIERTADGADDSWPDYSPTTALLGIDRDDVPALRGVQIDPFRCVGCDACINLCPTGAMQLDTDAAGYVIDSHRCSGCRLCGDVCEQAAVEVSSTGQLPSRSAIALNQRVCRVCGVAFHLPYEQTSGDRCHICRVVNHKRNLFQVLT